MSTSKIEARIARMKRASKKTWLVDEIFVCEDCGEAFRYKTNLTQHSRKCPERKKVF